MRTRKIQRSVSERVGYAILLIVLTLLAVTVIYPFINMIAISLSDTSAVRSGAITLLPKIYRGERYRVGATWEAYKMVATNKAVYLGYFNTIKVCVITCALSLVLTSFAAYPMAFSKIRFKKLYTQFIVITMWFSAGTMPNYMVIRQLGLIDSYWALILCTLLSAYNIIIMRGFFYGIPQSIVESAKMDGANDFVILFKMILPNCGPILATIGLWVVVGQWNQYQNPLLYIESDSKRVLQQVLASVIGSAGSEDFDISGSSMSMEQVRNAALMFTMLPIVAAFPFFQKFLISGTMTGAVKE